MTRPAAAEEEVPDVAVQEGTSIPGTVGATAEQAAVAVEGEGASEDVEAGVAGEEKTGAEEMGVEGERQGGGEAAEHGADGDAGSAGEEMAEQTTERPEGTATAADAAGPESRSPVPSPAQCRKLRRSGRLPDAWAFLQAALTSEDNSSGSGSDLFVHTGADAGGEASENHQWRCCAVVGNGGGLLQQRYGAEIDAHEVVFRINQAPLRPYAPHVGTKATFRVLNKLWAINYGSADVVRKLPLPLEQNVSLVLSLRESEVPELMPAVQSAMHSLQRHADVSVRVLAPGPVSIARRALADFRTCNRQAGRQHPGGPKPTSGIATLVGLLHRCRSVSVYGIGDHPKAGVQWHYYRLASTHRYRGARSHSFGNEHDFVAALAAHNHLRMCTPGDCRGPPPQC